MLDVDLEFGAALTKAVLYGGLLSSAGVVFAEGTLRAPSESTRFLASAMRRAAIVVIGAAVVSVLILFLRLGGEADSATVSAVFFSSAGAATCLQIIGAVLLLAMPLDDPLARGMRVSNAALALASFAFNGHAAAAGFFEGLVVVFHTVAAAWWVGSLLLLRRACAQAQLTVLSSTELSTLVRRFSSLAMKLVGGLVVAGSVLVIELIDFSGTPALSPYVRLLAAKIGLVAVVLAIASYNKLRLTPRLLAGDSAAVRQLGRSINAELALIAAVLVTTAILTTYTAPD